MNYIHYVIFGFLLLLVVALIWALCQLMKPTTFYNIDPSEDDV